jgi:hypothetical protein
MLMMTIILAKDTAMLIESALLERLAESDEASEERRDVWPAKIPSTTVSTRLLKFKLEIWPAKVSTDSRERWASLVGVESEDLLVLA